MARDRPLQPGPPQDEPLRTLASQGSSLAFSRRSQALTTFERQMSYGALTGPASRVLAGSLQPPTRRCARGEVLPGEQGSPVGPVLCRSSRSAASGDRRGRLGEATKHIFDFLRSRDAHMACPFCGREDWHGWDERVALEHVAGSATVDRGTEAFPLTCANCGFIRLQSAHVLDDPRAPRPSPPRA